MNSAINTFIQNVVDEIKDYNANENELVDIPFVVSTLQQLKDGEFEEFIKDIEENDYTVIYSSVQGGYGYYGSIHIRLHGQGFSYNISLLIDDRNDGYCDCQPEDEDYREDKECCGYNCDWSAPAFNLTKEISMGYRKWQGTQHDYWEFEDEFYEKDKQLKKERNEKQKNDKITYLTNMISKLKNELEELREEI